MPDLRSRAGQASTEYVGLLAVLAVVLAAVVGAVAVADPGIPRAVVAKLRLALCVVGGDVCSADQARGRGLDPCVVRGDARERASGGSFVIRFGGRRRYAIEERSDGSFVVSAADGQDASGGVGLSAQLGPAFKVGASGALELRFTAGKAWVLPDRATLDRLLRRVPNRYDLANRLAEIARIVPEPTMRYTSGGAGLEAGVSLDVGDDRHSTSPLGGGAGARGLLGRSSGPDGTTYYYEVGGETSGAFARVLPGLDGAGARQLVEWRTGTPPVITVRTSTAGEGRVQERVVRLRLSRPDDLAAARRFAASGGRLAAEDLARRVHARGSVERLTYAEETDEEGLNYTAGLGPVRFGADHSTTAVRRRLVAAEVTIGGRSVQRLDCLDRS